FTDIVNAHDVSAAEYRRRHRAGRSKLRLLRVRVCQEALAGGSHHDGHLQPVQLTEPRQNHGVVFLAFAEAEARIDDHARLLDPRTPGATDGGFQIACD